MLLDQRQHLLGVEARRQYQTLGHLQRVLDKDTGRAVIERRGHQRTAPWHDPDGLGHHRSHARGLVLKFAQRHRAAQHALGTAGGARRIGQMSTRRNAWAVVRRLRGEPGFVGDGDGGGAGGGGGIGVAAVHGQHGHACGNHFAHRREQIGLDDQHAGAAVLQQEAGFLRREMPVDRAVVDAGRPAREDDVGEHRVIAQHHGHHRALLKPQPPQATRQPVTAVEHFGAGAVQRFEPEVCGHAGSPVCAFC
jgi:hypothetical protein